MSLGWLGCCCLLDWDVHVLQVAALTQGRTAWLAAALYRVSLLAVFLQLFFRGASELENFMLKSATRELVDALVAAEPGPAAEDALFGLFAEYMVHNYSAELQTYRCHPNP